MADGRNRVLDRLEDLLAGAALGLVGLLPGPLALVLLGGTARLAFWLSRRRRRQTRGLVERGLGLARGDPRADAIVAGAYRCLALNVVEPGLVQRGLKRGLPLERYVEIEGLEHLHAALGAEKGILLCTGHFGAWELLSVFMAELGWPIWALARPLDNPYLERRLLERRLVTWKGFISKLGGGLKLARVLKDGEIVGALLDQNAGRQGVVLDFLGAPTSHHNVAGVVARRFGATVLPVYVERLAGPLRYRLSFEAPVPLDTSLPAAAAEIDLTARLSASLAARVRARPEQWLWLHDRWRHARDHGLRAENAQPLGEPLPQGTNET